MYVCESMKTKKFLNYEEKVKNISSKINVVII